MGEAMWTNVLMGHTQVIRASSASKRQRGNLEAFVPLRSTNFVPRRHMRKGFCNAHYIGDSTRKDRSSLPQRIIISANSLEESKKRAKSQYDNIPDLDQQYLGELSWVERKYGRKTLKKNISKEAQGSILRKEGALRPAEGRSVGAEEGEESDKEADLSQYKTIRNQLIGNTLFVGALGLCAMWGFGTLKDVQSFALGLAGSVAYVILLSRSVDRLAEAAKEGGTGADALQPARIAILVILVLASAKNADKLSVLPVMYGFFSYKLATLVPLVTGEAFE